jgi:hypothetical protein
MTLTFSHNVDVNFEFVEIAAKKVNQPQLEDGKIFRSQHKRC